MNVITRTKWGTTQCSYGVHRSLFQIVISPITSHKQLIQGSIATNYWQCINASLLFHQVSRVFSFDWAIISTMSSQNLNITPLFSLFIILFDQFVYFKKSNSLHHVNQDYQNLLITIYQLSLYMVGWTEWPAHLKLVWHMVWLRSVTMSGLIYNVLLGTWHSLQKIDQD